MPGVLLLDLANRLLGLLPLTFEVSHGDVEAVFGEFDGDAASGCRGLPPSRLQP